MNTSKIGTKFAIYAILTFFLILWAYPVYVAVTKSFNVGGLNNYKAVITNKNINYFRVVFNSLLISIATTLIVVLITTLGAYAFSKMRFHGRNVLYILLLACLAVPAAAVTSPMFFTVKSLHLMNTYLALILPLTAFNAPMMLMIVRTYFDGVPDEIIEAATVYSCSSFGIYTRILMPLSTPVIANIGTLTFVYSWNDYLIPLLFTRNENMYTVTLAATYFMDTQNQTAAMVAQLYAALILMTIPSVIVYLFAQKYLQMGITAGAVKS